MKSTLFLTLRTFSATGGIEKVCRIMGKALYEKSIEEGTKLEICSMYDTDNDSDDNTFFPKEYFKGYGVQKLLFTRAMVMKGIKADTVILSHINLLMIGWMIKKISPKTKIVLLAHGIEIWDKISNGKKKWLRQCDQILSVSNFTRNNIISSHKLDPSKCAVLNNCLDPFLPIPSITTKDKTLLDKYGFKNTDQVLMTLTRLSSRERYKGYDKVIAAIAKLKAQYPSVKYLIAGSYDTIEKEFLNKMISQLGLEENVVMAGYIQDEELEAHFALADVYVMPSRKEGFGIVFIEAMYYHLPVIAGNRDGSVDALLNGRLGELVNPENIDEITHALNKILSQKPESNIPDHRLLMDNFGYDSYKEKLADLAESRK